MRKFVLSEQLLGHIMLSAADTCLAEGRTFTEKELRESINFIAQLTGVLTIEDGSGDKNGN